MNFIDIYIIVIISKNINNKVVDKVSSKIVTAKMSSYERVVGTRHLVASFIVVTTLFVGVRPQIIGE